MNKKIVVFLSIYKSKVIFCIIKSNKCAINISVVFDGREYAKAI